MDRPRDGDSLMRDVGRRIAALRRDLSWTQETLAQRLRCSVKYVQSVEGGKQNLTLRSLARLGRTLGVDVAHLLRVPRRSKGR